MDNRKMTGEKEEMLRALTLFQGQHDITEKQRRAIAK